MITCKYLFIQVYRIKKFSHQNLPGSKALSKVNEGRDIYSQCGWELWVSKQKRTFVGEQHACKGATCRSGIGDCSPVAGEKLWEKETHLKICLKFLFNTYFNRLLILYLLYAPQRCRFIFLQGFWSPIWMCQIFFLICLFFEGLDGQIHVQDGPTGFGL